MNNAILLDFGSTFTKAAVVDLEKKEIAYRTKTPSTVNTNAKDALDVLYGRIRNVIGENAFSHARKLATSSAAGGLRMIVVGLTPTLSIMAGKNAAFSAGAKVLKSYSGALTEKDVEEIEKTNAEIILLAGGFEKGNTSEVKRNAHMLGLVNNNVPIIYAGNSELIKELKIFFYLHHKECFVVNNIIPDVGVIDALPAQELIRNIFLQRIINMKGLDKVRNEIEQIAMPTPAAVLEAGELLSEGYGGGPGLGNLMIVDIGGATTDIHTYCETKAYDGAKIIGAPEPYAKRTVEADLGMRESSGSVIEEIGCSRVANDIGITSEQLMRSVNRRLGNIAFLPGVDSKTEGLEVRIDQQIAKYACQVAVRRHSGNIEYVYSKVCAKIQRGKNLSEITTIIGTGGPVINSINPREILQTALMTEEDKRYNYMLPKKAKFMIDEDYVLYAAGVLKQIDPEGALAIMKNSLKYV